MGQRLNQFVPRDWRELRAVARWRATAGEVRAARIVNAGLWFAIGAVAGAALVWLDWLAG